MKIKRAGLTKLITATMIMACIFLKAWDAQAGCPGYEPEISVKNIINPVQYINNYTIEQISAASAFLDRGRVLTHLNTDIIIVPYDEKKENFCLNIRSVEAKYLMFPIVYKAENLAYGTCSFTAALKREQKHMDVAIKVYKKSIAGLHTQIKNSIEQLPVLKPISFSQAEQAKEEFTEALRQDTEKYTEMVKKEMSKNLQAIENQEPYANALKRCNNQ